MPEQSQKDSPPRSGRHAESRARGCGPLVCRHSRCSRRRGSTASPRGNGARSVVLQVSNADKFVAERLSCVLRRQIKEIVDELNLTKKIISCHPSNLRLPDHVDCSVALNRSPSRLKFSEALFGVHSTFDGSMILFQNVV